MFLIIPPIASEMAHLKKISGACSYIFAPVIWNRRNVMGGLLFVLSSQMILQFFCPYLIHIRLLGKSEARAHSILIPPPPPLTSVAASVMSTIHWVADRLTVCRTRRTLTKLIYLPTDFVLAKRLYFGGFVEISRLRWCSLNWHCSQIVGFVWVIVSIRQRLVHCECLEGNVWLLSFGRRHRVDSRRQPFGLQLFRHWNIFYMNVTISRIMTMYFVCKGIVVGFLWGMKFLDCSLELFNKPHEGQIWPLKD